MRLDLQSIFDSTRTGPIAWGAGAVVVIAGVLTLVIVFRPPGAPDVAQGKIDSIASFVMTPDFNNLSTQERLKYMTAFANRYNNLTDDDAVALAEFIADMDYQKRRQIEENMSRLAIDYLDEAAAAYQDVPPGQRELFLQQMLIDMDKMGDEINDAQRNLSDDERMARMRRHGQREQEQAKQEISSQVDPRGANMLFNIYNSEVSERVPATRRGAIARLMLDLTKVRRGDAIDTRK